MNSKNRKTSGHHRLMINVLDKIKLKRSDKYVVVIKVLDKIKLKRSDKYVALSNLCIYYTWTNIEKLYRNSKFETSSPTWNETFELPIKSYSVLDTLDHF